MKIYSKKITKQHFDSCIEHDLDYHIEEIHVSNVLRIHASLIVFMEVNDVLNASRFDIFLHIVDEEERDAKLEYFGELKWVSSELDFDFGQAVPLMVSMANHWLVDQSLLNSFRVKNLEEQQALVNISCESMQSLYNKQG